MPQIENAEQAIETAEKVVSRYQPFRQLRLVRHENGEWVVEFDVGVLSQETVRVRVDEKTGFVSHYDKLSPLSQ